MCGEPLRRSSFIWEFFAARPTLKKFPTKFTDGDYQIRLAARDAALNRDTSDPYTGNTSSVHVIRIIINNTPDNKDQCKDGGRVSFFSPTFKNQGDCVSYVQSNGHAVGNKEK